MGGTGNDVVLTVVPSVVASPAPALDDRGSLILVVSMLVLGVLALRRLNGRVAG
jgi:hypothetical protein